MAESFGDRVKRLRLASGASQVALAEAAGTRIGTLRSWERGRRLPSLEAAWKLAQALGVSLDELAGDGQFGLDVQPREIGRPKKAELETPESPESPPPQRRKKRKEDS